MPEAVILAQGDELMTGQTVDTNSNWLAGRLWALGVPVRRVMSAPDRLEDIVQTLKSAADLAPIVVSTGGLGPTRDDLTAEAVSTAFDMPLEFDPLALSQVKARYQAWGRTVLDSSRKQALLPRGCELLENLWGTAPAFAVQIGSSKLYFLPGVPREMRPLFETRVEPDIISRHDIRAPALRILRTAGMPESELEQRLRDLRAPGLSVGYRAMSGEVQVKLRFDPDVPPATQGRLLHKVRAQLGTALFGVDSGDLAEVIGERLVARGETLALAESCTAGGLAAWIASVPGASRYLLEGAVVYSNEAKVRTAGVDPATLDAHGAVSEPVARQLAQGIRARAGTSWGVGITGIAGPGGGTPEKPVGTVHIAIAGPQRTVHRKLALNGDRERIMAWSRSQALKLLLDEVDGSGAH